MASVTELSFRVFGSDMVILTGRSPILNVKENRDYDFRWVQVYTRASGDWQLAVSQATRLRQTRELQGVRSPVVTLPRFNFGAQIT